MPLILARFWQVLSIDENRMMCGKRKLRKKSEFQMGFEPTTFQMGFEPTTIEEEKIA